MISNKTNFHIHNPIKSDLGFILCRECDDILGIPTLSDLACYEIKSKS